MPSLAFHLNCKAQLFATLDIELTCGNFNLLSLGFRRYRYTRFPGSFLLTSSSITRTIIPVVIISRSMTNLSVFAIDQILAYRRRINKLWAIFKIRDSYHRVMWSGSPCRFKVILLRRQLMCHIIYDRHPRQSEGARANRIVMLHRP